MTKGIILASVLFVSGFCSFKISSAEFHFVNIYKNYTSAQRFCREEFTDLATVGNSSDVLSLAALVPNETISTWIGLQIAEAPTWHWAIPEDKLVFLNWKAGEPKGSSPEGCGALNPEGQWFESACNTKRGFVCAGNRTHGPRFVAERKSWRRSQDHCRGLASDLASVRSAAENAVVQRVRTEASVWIGLFKDPWGWSDGSTASYRHWRSNQPNSREPSCTLAVWSAGGQWNDRLCQRRRRFICQGVRRIRPTSPLRTSPDTTTTTAPVPPTDVEKTTLQSTPVSAMTATTHTTAGHNLILIQKNMSWNEARSYCRSHHSALLSVHSQDLQQSAVRVAENATSAHVWLGLRYTGAFHFWFWTKWGAGCYQNWAPGHGAERQYDRDMAGALETTRGQQWVGLPETQELNFICVTCAEAAPDRS